MREYLIRAADREEFNIHLSKWPDVLKPRSYPSKVIQGWGLLRLEVLSCEISFSAEPPGIQIVFESGEIAPEVADQIVKEIVESAEALTGQQGEIIPLQWRS
jgi:hypothetical protein